MPEWLFLLYDQQVGFHLIFAATIGAIATHLYRTRAAGYSARRVVRVSLFYLLCIQWGFGAASMSVGHILFSDQVAGFIGWQAGSPFQV